MPAEVASQARAAGGACDARQRGALIPEELIRSALVPVCPVPLMLDHSLPKQMLPMADAQPVGHLGVTRPVS